VTQSELRAELSRRLPFETGIMLCRGRDILGLLSGDRFAGLPVRRDIVRFVSILAKSPASAPSLPLSLPPRGPWQLKLLARDGRFVFGAYRRQMQAIGYLGEVDRLFGVPATTRNWNTIAAIAKVLRNGET
jgi:hypothetical protein